MAPTIYMDDEKRSTARAIHMDLSKRRRDRKMKPIAPLDAVKNEPSSLAMDLSKCSDYDYSRDSTGSVVNQLEQLQDWEIFLAAKFKVNNRRTGDLMKITLRTIFLMHRSRILQRELSQLQYETKEFMSSVMANPENMHFPTKTLLNGQLLHKEVESINV